MTNIPDTHTGGNYKCMNCGFAKEVTIPCNSCGDTDVVCLFCGEMMTKVWKGYNE